jgi:magnesium-transporting ATPase (P-type)
MKKVYVAIALIFLISLAALPLGVLAQQDKIPENIQSPEQLVKLVTTLTDWIFTIFILLAVVFIVIGAMQFVTAGGKPESVSEARQKIIWAAVGIIVALVARAIPAVLENIILKA